MNDVCSCPDLFNFPFATIVLGLLSFHLLIANPHDRIYIEFTACTQSDPYVKYKNWDRERRIQFRFPLSIEFIRSDKTIRKSAFNPVMLWFQFVFQVKGNYDDFLCFASVKDQLRWWNNARSRRHRAIYIYCNLSQSK